jgi:hypothetical protein
VVLASQVRRSTSVFLTCPSFEGAPDEPNDFTTLMCFPRPSNAFRVGGTRCLKGIK